jgi:hypothetical protein
LYVDQPFACFSRLPQRVIFKYDLSQSKSQFQVKTTFSMESSSC